MKSYEVNLTAIVKDILFFDKNTRKDDRALTIAVYKRYGVDVDHASFAEIMLDKTLPSQETIGRARRDVQKKFKELRADLQTQKVKSAIEQEYRTYFANAKS